jgi:flagellar biosynthetic protein FliR
MSFDAFLPWALSVALLSVRLTIALALSPAFASYGVPVLVRVALTVGFAALTFAHRTAPDEAHAWAAAPLLMLPAVSAEILIGALLGLGVHVVLAAFALAGRLMDVQIGFGIGSVFDPVTRTGANALGTLMSLVGIALFFATDAHLALVQLLSRSIDVLPLGRLPAFDDPLRPVLAAGAMFALGVALAAPVALALLLTDLAVGVVSRNMPQINVLVLAMPLKVLVGYSVLALAVAGWAPLVQRGFGDMGEALGAR